MPTIGGDNGISIGGSIMGWLLETIVICFVVVGGILLIVVWCHVIATLAANFNIFDFVKSYF
jgi:hypothetical protein